MRVVRALKRGGGHGLGFIAFLMGCLTLFVGLVGGLRVEWSGFSLSATHVLPVLLQYLAVAGLGWVFAPIREWKSTFGFRPLVAFFRFIAGFRRPRTLSRWTLALGVVLLLHQGELLRQRALVWQAEAVKARGDLDLAADLYARALNSYSWDTQRGVKIFERANCLYRGGRYQECADLLLEPVFSGWHENRRGYRDLWTSLMKLERYEEARSVLMRAMGVFPSLGQECAHMLAVIDRHLLEATAPPTVVRFVFDAPGEQGPFYLAGNWNPQGRQDEVRGYQPQLMIHEEEGRWTLERSLSLTDEFPYFTFVKSHSQRHQGGALGYAQFFVPSDLGAGKNLTISLTAMDLKGASSAAVPMERRAADGRKRVWVLWPDCGSWPLTNIYMQCGWLPHTSRLMEEGLSLSMRSTEPPYTSTAYLRMTDLNAGIQDGASRSFLETLALQFKGIPFLDGLFSDDLVGDVEDPGNLFYILGRAGFSAANMVFSDKFLAVDNDLVSGSGQELEVSENELDSMDAMTRSARGLGKDRQALVLSKIMGIDPVENSSRYQVLEDSIAAQVAILNSQQKLEMGLKAWSDHDLDFLLLRFPAVDIVSHVYGTSVWDDPLKSPLAEVYRHVDDALGEIQAQLDADDTLILVSDHGLLSQTAHHGSCVFMAQGPGLEGDTQIPSEVPIGNFPCFVLTRFGIVEGIERFSEAERAAFLSEENTK